MKRVHFFESVFFHFIPGSSLAPLGESSVWDGIPVVPVNSWLNKKIAAPQIIYKCSPIYRQRAPFIKL